MSLWQEWMNRAACRPGSGLDPDLWFPIGREPLHPDAGAACQRCPVNEDCLSSSLNDPGKSVERGYWAGMDEEERQNLKRRRNRHLAVAS